ncbi:carbamoyltransferase HypF [Cohaesibacter gelatinilyticus]|uniref:Carbamoyltransferase HypF n=1 Tax=Cohaesibacter gelatinilyticus TaxID=372072 RepID=A0A285PJJ4_9HYPH|nr:carbamoyltransferase HypF [Cohaesibacter gelatinilyticus]SNZ21437.1 Hydrogenase maturation protein, carbamoyltransferase HypF [Cohaesibacter gelatinilyticus]
MPDPLSHGSCHSIRVRGLVQGVGFRPTVWQVAKALKLKGDVRNDGEGVLIRLAADQNELAAFVQNLRNACPPLARIDTIECQPLDELVSFDDFSIAASAETDIATGIVPDAATCPDCLADIEDPPNRRYRYPFTNCTHCGPRLSIIKQLPYDRAYTSMAEFEMCAYCQAEYDDPADRRFHAQPNACPDCGPQLSLIWADGTPIMLDDEQDAIQRCASLLKQGRIVAIKGIGGFHLAVDASNEDAVAELRARKLRYGKPLALMARDLDMVRSFCKVGEIAENLLLDRAAPIVLLEQKENAAELASAIAPGQRRLGFMLPYSPLHSLLMQELDHPLVMTSGNLSSEPQVIDNEEALQRLSSIADAFLMHDRAIINRLDDSVLHLVDDRAAVLRRARGFAPEPLPLPAGFETAPDILAIGGEVKNTFCLLEHGQLTLSHHIGDMENPKQQKDYRRALDLYASVRNFEPQRIALDCHQGYFSTRLGETLAVEQDCLIDAIQHHHAHLAACMAEYALPLDHGPVLGVVLDGLGSSEEGELWGGEFLLGTYQGYERLAHFASVAMPGGGKASYEPWRNCFAQLRELGGWEQISADYADLEIIRWLGKKPLTQMNAMIERGLNAPKASSAGRLFDAVAACLDMCRDQVRYEGEAAMLLQAHAEEAFVRYSETQIEPYEKELQRSCEEQSKEPLVLTWRPLWRGILEDLRSGKDRDLIAARFHQTLIVVIADLATELAQSHSVKKIALTGGVLQNVILCEGVAARLRKSDLEVLIPRLFPANDGGLALGQAMISAARAIAASKTA